MLSMLRDRKDLLDCFGAHNFTFEEYCGLSVLRLTFEPVHDLTTRTQRVTGRPSLAGVPESK